MAGPPSTNNLPPSYEESESTAKSQLPGEQPLSAASFFQPPTPSPSDSAPTPTPPYTGPPIGFTPLTTDAPCNHTSVPSSQPPQSYVGPPYCYGYNHSNPTLYHHSSHHLTEYVIDPNLAAQARLRRFILYATYSIFVIFFAVILIMIIVSIFSY